MLLPSNRFPLTVKEGKQTTKKISEIYYLFCAAKVVLRRVIVPLYNTSQLADHSDFKGDIPLVLSPFSVRLAEELYHTPFFKGGHCGSQRLRLVLTRIRVQTKFLELFYCNLIRVNINKNHFCYL